MSSDASKRVVWAATFADIVIVIAKFLAAAFTGSSAMLAEAIHSTVDTGNELLLLFGMHRATRPPDALHPYGHGKALYFYSLIVAVYIFGLGGVVTVWEGISRLHHPEHPTQLVWNYVVLVLSGAFNFYSWRIAYRELKASKDPDESLINEILTSKDPTVFTVFLVDSAAIVGTVIALVGIFLAHAFSNPYFDAGASILIGLLLAAVAILLGRETGALLVGERIRGSQIRRVREIVEGDPAVEHAGNILTMQLGPQQGLVTADVRFRRGLTQTQIESAIARLRKRIHEQEPTIERIYLQVDPFNGENPNSLAA